MRSAVVLVLLLVACAGGRSTERVGARPRPPAPEQVRMPTQQPLPGIDVARRPPPRDSSLLILCPSPPTQYGDGRVEERRASRRESRLADRQFRVVALLISSYSVSPRPMTEGAAAAYKGEAISGASLAAIARPDAHGRAVLSWSATDSMTLMARAIGYAPLTHRHHARVGYVDTLVFWMRTDIHHEC